MTDDAKLCEDVQDYRSYLRDVSRDIHRKPCARPASPLAICPYDAWKRDGDEAWYDEEYGPPVPCDCCADCRASCARDAGR